MTDFLVGTYAHTGEASIVAFRADFDARSMERIMENTLAECPSYLLRHPNGKVLYAVRELTEEGALYTFAMTDKGLELRSTMLTGGMDPCHLALDDSGRFLVVTNYSGGSLAVFSLDEAGLPVARTFWARHTGSGPVRDRQAMAHPHCSLYWRDAFYVCDLGGDRLYRYKLNRTSGTLQAQAVTNMPSGFGPRHLLPSPVENMLYVVAELESKVCVLKADGEALELVQVVSTLPEGFEGYNISAALKLSSDQRALLVSNRGHNSLCVLQIMPDGTLKQRSHCPSGGNTPRDFTVFGDCVVVANQDSSLLCVLHYDAEQFVLSPTGLTAPIIRPTMVLNLG